MNTTRWALLSLLMVLMALGMAAGARADGCACLEDPESSTGASLYCCPDVSSEPPAGGHVCGRASADDLSVAGCVDPETRVAAGCVDAGGTTVTRPEGATCDAAAAAACRACGCAEKGTECGDPAEVAIDPVEVPSLPSPPQPPPPPDPGPICIGNACFVLR